jgi:hypothetical protein
MILVRDVFQLKFGKAKNAKALWKKGNAINRKLGYGPGRGMVDLAGTYYTFVLETTYKDLTDYERALKKAFRAKEWSNWYKQFMPLVESGHREIYTVLE